jgi:hypothetical protein
MHWEGVRLLCLAVEEANCYQTKTELEIGGKSGLGVLYVQVLSV